MSKTSNWEEAATEIHSNLVASVHHAMSVNDGDVEARDKAYSEALEAINQAVREHIIGENENPDGLTSYYPGVERDSQHREGRNILREWQRELLDGEGK